MEVSQVENISIMTATPWLASACLVAGSHVQTQLVQTKHGQAQLVKTQHVQTQLVQRKLRSEQAAALLPAAYGPFATVRPMAATLPTVDDANGDANGVLRGPQPWRQLVIT
jgi:hypothetical protein